MRSLRVAVATLAVIALAGCAGSTVEAPGPLNSEQPPVAVAEDF